MGSLQVESDFVNKLEEISVLYHVPEDVVGREVLVHAPVKRKFGTADLEGSVLRTKVEGMHYMDFQLNLFLPSSVPYAKLGKGLVPGSSWYAVREKKYVEANQRKSMLILRYLKQLLAAAHENDTDSFEVLLDELESHIEGMADMEECSPDFPEMKERIRATKGEWFLEEVLPLLKERVVTKESRTRVKVEFP